MSNWHILSCENNAKLSGLFNDESSVSEVYIGGIVGTVSFTNIQRCRNNADIRDLQDWKFIGGIAACVSGFCFREINISHCGNAGLIGAAKSKHAINDYLPDNIGQKELNIGAIVGYHDSIVRLELCGCETQDKTIIPAIGNSPDSYYSIVYKK